MKKKHLGIRMPDTLLIVFAIIVIVAILGWVVPSGAYDYEKIDVNGTARSVAIPGSYRTVDKSEAAPCGVLGVFEALYRGCVSAADIIFVVLTCAGTFGVLVKTGAFHAGIGRVMKKVGGKDLVLIPVLMLVFALGGSVFGMLSEFYGFYPLIVGLMIALGYDAMTGFAVICLGEYVGFMAATLNPYTVAVAQSVAGVELYSGTGYRVLCFAVFMGISIAYVVRYALKVRRDPSKSVVLGDPCAHSFDRSQLDAFALSWRHLLVFADVAAALVLLMVGLMRWGWGYAELCGLFIAMAAVAAAVSGWSPNKFCKELVDSARSVLWGCLLTGIAKGIVVVMQDAQIMDTIIYSLSAMLENAPSWISAQLMLVVQTLINFLIPSGSGQAAVTMPIMAPLADSVGVSRQVACLAYQFGDGLSNLLWPTCGIVVACGLGDVRYDRWLKWSAKLLAMLFAAQMLLLQGAVWLGL